MPRRRSFTVPGSGRKRRTTNSEHGFPRYPNLVLGLKVEQSEQVWVSDTLAPGAQAQVSPTSACVTISSAFGVAVVMDVFTRSIRGWHLGRTLHQELTLTALQRALVTDR